jgi:CRP/FNR family transcriptional regulator, nitrogen oxide reductase regulator
MLTLLPKGESVLSAHATYDRARLDLKVEVFKRSTLFSCLDAEEIEQLTPAANFRHYIKDEFIFRQGDPPDFLYLVGSGKVRQYKVSASGKTFTASIMSSGDPLNAVALFGAKAFFVSAQAMVDTTVLSIPRHEFLSFVNKYPIVTTNLVYLLGRVVNSAWERLTDFAGEMTCQRVFNMLYMLYFKFGTTIPVTREEIADMTGTTTETTIRVLSKLKRLGVIDSRRGRIIVLNETKLRDMSQCSYLIHQAESNAQK